MRQGNPSESRPSESAAPGESVPLPDAYGTQRLKLTPRDPHWIHAHWDFTRSQLRAATAKSAEGRLTLRMFKESRQGPMVSETRVQPDAMQWMVHAPEPAAPYVAEIGFYDERRHWSSLAVAEPVRTPPAAASEDRAFEAATLTPEGVLQMHGTAVPLEPPQRPLVDRDTGQELNLHSAALHRLGPSGRVQAPAGVSGLAPSSLGISSWRAAGLPSSPSSAMGGAAPPAFRLEVNAELIVYGSTEPNATLRIGDKVVPLNSDGTFRLRFALPDGTYELPVKATAADTGEERAAHLRFQRTTKLLGDVGSAEKAPGLKPPDAENL